LIAASAWRGWVYTPFLYADRAILELFSAYIVNANHSIIALAIEPAED
jgi:hypothetical protein